MMAMVSNLDLSVLHPSSADRTPMPLHGLIQWEAERLWRVSRWRGPDDAGKDIVRAYDQTFFSMQEFGDAAGKLPMHAVQSQGPANLKFSEPAKVAPSAVVVKSAVRSRPTKAPQLLAARSAGSLPSLFWSFALQHCRCC